MTAGQGALYENLSNKLHILYDRDHLGVHAKILKFHQRLQEKYPRAHDYCLFHLLVGSTGKGNYLHHDFPDPDSVEAFINTEYYRRFPQ